ncbi:ribokinase [Peribacillus frigoritolerans]|uniref:ribokinase n=1 Tax=Peribacillus frigoritolerans TaxID=450367 RepID=UPI001059EC2C|nr:ribokinase [Peribacillus frigoritolerans]TDL80890.1 ribokinase [Peribacillus frigoritolerans]
MNKIAVIGSLNIDLVAVTDISPKMGETVLGKEFNIFPGGKGANQATAAARLGGSVKLFGTVGDDQHGNFLLDQLSINDVGIGDIQKQSEAPTGCAMIEICDAQNRIIVVPGANAKTDEDYLQGKINGLLEAEVILISMEIPMNAIEYIVKELAKYGKKIILNPAPAVPLSEEVISRCTYLLPNEHEAEIIFNGKYDEAEALKKHPNKLLITKGEQGITYFTGHKMENVPAIKVNPVDSTGAGDTFAGAFAFAISERKPLKECIQFAAIAAGLSVEKRGAQSGMPTAAEVQEYCSRVASDD